MTSKNGVFFILKLSTILRHNSKDFVTFNDPVSVAYHQVFVTFIVYHKYLNLAVTDLLGVG